MTDTQEAMREELLPCPFCGSQPTRRVTNDILIIECPSCISVGFHNHVRFGCRADEEWNTRIAATAQSADTIADLNAIIGVQHTKLVANEEKIARLEESLAIFTSANDTLVAKINKELRRAAAAELSNKQKNDALLVAQEFIRNGIEFGYIRMPDVDTPDPAHETPRIIAEALAQPISAYWLIERNQLHGEPNARWFSERRYNAQGCSDLWVQDTSRAQRFTTKEEAESSIRERFLDDERYPVLPTATEHIDCSSVPDEDAQIAMLIDVLKKAKKCIDILWVSHHANRADGALELIEKAISATQATADAWEAEVKARALEELADKWLLNVSNDPTKAMSIKYLKDEAAELRNQQPEQPRKPCTCDGWCDGFCLTKEGKKL